jgi:hypothetical protein
LDIAQWNYAEGMAVTFLQKTENATFSCMCHKNLQSEKGIWRRGTAGPAGLTPQQKTKEAQCSKSQSVEVGNDAEARETREHEAYLSMWTYRESEKSTNM